MKLNLLIIDDEELIRKGLIARLNYLGFSFERVFQAGSGSEALEIVKQNDISIVITDIRMPDGDGLTFIAETKKIDPLCRFMVLSGFAEFEYAKTAMRLGVSAYLLKPLSNEELKSELDKLLEQMERDDYIREGIKSKNKLEKQTVEYSLEREMNALLHEPTPETAGRDKYAAICDRLSCEASNLLRLGIVNIDEKSCDGLFQPEDTELIRFAVKNVFGEISSPGKVLLVDSLISQWQMYAVFESGGRDKGSLRREIEQVFLEMRAVLEKKMGIYLTMGISGCAPMLSGSSLSEAETALRQRMVHGDTNLYFYDDDTVFSGKSFPSTDLHSLEQYMVQGNTKGIHKLLLRLFSDEMVHKCGVSYIRILWVRILNMLLKYYEPEIRQFIGMEKMLSSFRTLDGMYRLDEICQYIWEIIIECINGSSVQDTNSTNKILLATQYIQKHYNENLSINTLAERYNMSPNYFSSVFKKELNQSTVNYITEIRVKKAMEYLEKSDQSVVEIAQKVGYEDSQYFFRVFKKATGITPLQYRLKFSKNHTKQ